MDTPLYPPAAAFEQPAVAPYTLSLGTVSVEELMHNPAAWAIVVERFPAMKFAAGAGQAKPHLGNMTVRDFAGFMGMKDSPALAAIDDDLARLPADRKAAP